MGTNFHIRRKLNQNEKYTIIQSIVNDDYEKARILINQEDLEIHIGKLSGGWKFLWNVHNFKYFNPTKEDFIKFLKTYGQIFDEYGRKYTFEEFWDNEVGEIRYTGIDLKEYYDSNYELYRHYSRKEEFEPFEKLELTINEYGEFYLDDMRCTIYDDFR